MAYVVDMNSNFAFWRAVHAFARAKKFRTERQGFVDHGTYPLFVKIIGTQIRLMFPKQQLLRATWACGRARCQKYFGVFTTV